MYNLNKVHPLQIDDLVRVGKNADGGYILSNQQIEKTEILLSFGIYNEWSFEQDFYKKKNEKLTIYAFDYSATPLKLVYRALKHLDAFVRYCVTGRISLSTSSLKRTICCLQASMSLKRFFRKDKNRFFIPKFLGPADDNLFCSISSIFDKLLNGDVKNLSVFIKMDIEKWEYCTLPQFVPFFNKINGLVVEFHNLDIAGKNFENIIDILSPYFDIAHVHANNAGGLIYGTNLPMLLEVTFINKDLLISRDNSKQNYPIKDIDFPNIAGKPDIPLSFG
ncbi:MAG: hypothetical protein LBG80_17490 [Bacteroidales bacterium]|jgi:hypothetical protein|nr:hypothetical protein [Bacteroidales bacterium]